MFRKFINREGELAFLNDKYHKDGFNLIVLYGRRRVGKTELVKRFVKDKPFIYFLADKRGTESNAERFKEKISEFLKEPKVELDAFDKLLSYLCKKQNGQKLIVAIDEFSYLVEKDSSIPSVFQLVIDEVLTNSNLYLILLGSSISMMEEGTLSKNSPLYGRRTGQYKIKPLSFKEVTKFFPHYNISECLQVYSILGGVPFYLTKVDDNQKVTNNISQLILRKGEILHEEVDFLLKEELRESATYKSILEAIASGYSRTVEIANKSRIEAKDLDKYLKILTNLEYVEKLAPITEKPASKKTIYRVSDNFFRFWFRFCLPRSSELELGDVKTVLKNFEKESNAFMGKTFEQVAIEFLKQKRFFDFTKVGPWWGHYRNEKGQRKEVEIDLVALNENSQEILLGECKWKDNVDAKKIIDELKEKAQYAEWLNGKRVEQYCVFAKSFKDKTKIKGAYLFDLEDIRKSL